MSVEEYSGIEFLSKMRDGELPHAPMAKTIPMKITTVESGHIIYEVQPQAEHVNLQGGVHGGFCATVLDSVTGAAAHTIMEKGQRFATVDLGIKMIRPMQVGKTYYGVGDLINAGRSLVITEGKIIDDQNKIYATGTATLMMIQR